ncbi:MAG: hypothetical protein R3C49_11845 [Planctomycetaceae bacterium]
MDLKPIVRRILEDYALTVRGDHGVTHWARVLENGLRICETEDANPDVVSLFAVFHDSCRQNECHDPGHGLRGARLAKQLRGELFELSDADFHLLYTACADHTDEQTHPDVTVQACFDADRLDLGRVGIAPESEWLSTAAARSPEMLKWADGRAGFRFVPEIVTVDWGL